MIPLAHSARTKLGIPAQEYAKHIEAVEARAAANAAALAHYSARHALALKEEVARAARFHDLGKLHPENQRVLRSERREALRIAHEYAGVHHLHGMSRHVATVLAYYHHSGLKNLSSEFGSQPFRQPLRDGLSEADIDAAIQSAGSCYAAHTEVFPNHADIPASAGRHYRELSRYGGLFWRLALSCLVDADHGDTARHYGQEEDAQPEAPRWAERREALDRYVRGLGRQSSASPARQALRQEIYDECRDRPLEASLYCCDSPVGTGKTTAVMAHLLRVAQERDLRQVIVVLPYTNIVNQSAETYRNALVLGEENPEQVVAAHHHQADFGDPESRHLTTLWKCPIIVTTAVQFFESLAAAGTARLRKLNQLPGSALFIDEAHAAIPAWLWPQTWLWLKELTEDWCCHAVLASGSLARFWERVEFHDAPETIPNLISDGLREKSRQFERLRVNYTRHADPLGMEQAIDLIRKEKGPRLVIVNTVRSAGSLAREIAKRGMDVVHLSTALAPIHRQVIISRIKTRLEDPKDTDWTLVATSCVEAGVDFSFRSAVREAASACSLIQVAGRVNRGGNDESVEATVWTVTLAGLEFSRNPQLEASSRVLHALFEAGEVGKLDGSELATSALIRELNEGGHGDPEELLAKEKGRAYDEVAQKYKVIEDETVPVLVPPFSEALESGTNLNAKLVQLGAVRLRKKAVRKFGVQELAHYPGLYRWTLDYDPDFLGYLAGALATMDAEALNLLTV